MFIIFRRRVENLKRLNIVNWLTPAVTQRQRHKRQFSVVHRPKQKNPEQSQTLSSF